MALDNINLLSSSALSPNSDKILLYRSGGLEASTTLLSLTNSALNIAGVYLDIPNQRMGIGTNSPLAAAHIKGIGTTSSTTSLLVQNSAGTTAFNIKDNGVTNATYIEGGMCWFNNINSNGIVKFGSSLSVGFNTDPIAQLHIKGSGSTSATTSLLVQNSSGVSSTEIFDDGTFRHYRSAFFQNGGTISFASDRISMQGYTSFGIRYRSANLFELYASDALDVIGMQVGRGVTIYDSGASTAMSDSAKLQINSTTRGFLPPRMSTAQKNAIATPAAGLMVYDTDLNRPCFYSGSAWVTL